MSSSKESILDKTFIDELVKKITNDIPANLGLLKKDFELQLRHTIANCLNKFNLVSREEFDVQAAVLQRTREKLEQLQKKVEELERSHRR